jgi:hypothetical protein
MDGKVLDRSDPRDIREIDKSCKNKFKWNWLETEVTIKLKSGEKKVMLSEHIRKIDVDGRAKCIVCPDILNYGGRGKSTLTSHTLSPRHVKEYENRMTSQQLPAAYQLKKDPMTEIQNYGMHPMFKKIATETPAMKRLTPLQDRIVNQQVCTYKYDKYFEY